MDQDFRSLDSLGSRGQKGGPWTESLFRRTRSLGVLEMAPASVVQDNQQQAKSDPSVPGDLSPSQAQVDSGSSDSSTTSSTSTSSLSSSSGSGPVWSHNSQQPVFLSVEIISALIY